MKKEPINENYEIEEEVVPTEEEKKELESLLKAIQELEDSKNEEAGVKNKKGYIAIEFGGVFHHDLFINFTFNFILSLTLSFLLIELFNFATYDSIVYIVLFILSYTIIESIFSIYILMNHFQLIVKSVGFIFFFGYIIIFYLLDQYLFVNTISFESASVFVVFVGMFTIVRYFISYYIRQNFRKRGLR